jgi:SAM-dependent methyltransferase
MVSLGGALGGLTVGLVAVKIFNAYYEFGIGLVATLLIAAHVTRLMHPVVPVLVLVVAGFTGFHIYKFSAMLTRDAIVLDRNFYGTLRVRNLDAGQPNATRTLVNGVIMHGEQYQAPDRRAEPTSYYGDTSGVGRAIKILDAASPSIRVGVVGLGAGTIAAYGRKGDFYRYYEINPQVVDVARREFSFLGDAQARGAKVDVELGDARLTMEREEPQRYDLLAIDAFSSDSIPVHLITREAMEVYLRHMKPDGVIAFHTTNRFLRLAPVVKRIAGPLGLHVALIDDDARSSELSSTDWVLVTRNQALLQQPAIARYSSAIDDIQGLPVWTDDFNNLFQILK